MIMYSLFFTRAEILEDQIFVQIRVPDQAETAKQNVPNYVQGLEPLGGGLGMPFLNELMIWTP
jgi:hypothetical protein